MAIQWIGALITGLLLALVLLGIWWLVGSARKQRRREQAANRYAEQYDVEPGLGLVNKHRRPGHLLRDEDVSLTVAELVEEATAEGRPTRLNWSEDDERRAGPQDSKRPVGGEDEWPTGVLPKVPRHSD